MNDFQGWVTGNVATPVRHRVAASGTHVAEFRIASTRRWTDREGQGHESTSFLAVRCFGPLANNVTACLAVGEPVVVVGRLEVDEQVRDGHRTRDVTLMASGAGPNLALGTAAFRRSATTERGPASPQAA